MSESNTKPRIEDRNALEKWVRQRGVNTLTWMTQQQDIGYRRDKQEVQILIRRHEGEI